MFAKFGAARSSRLVPVNEIAILEESSLQLNSGIDKEAVRKFVKRCSKVTVMRSDQR